MAKISVEDTPVNPDWIVGSSISLSGHLLLIFTDDSSNEFVIRGGPTPLTPDRGNLILEVNIPIAQSADARGVNQTAADRGSIDLNLGGRNAIDVWEILKQHASQIHAQGFKYEPLGFNSTGPDASGLCSRISPGMAATADVKTGRRSILSYLVSPIEKAQLEAARER